MNPKHTASLIGRRLPLLAAGCLGFAFAADAMQSYEAYPPISTASTLPFEQLERHALTHVPYIKKLEVRDLLLKVDGYDQQGMKVKVHLDRRTGDLLTREVKYDKHGPFGKHGYGAVRGWAYPPAGYPQPTQAPGARPPAGGVAPRTYYPTDPAPNATTPP